MTDRLTSIIANYIGHIARRLPDDLYAELRNMQKEEDTEPAKSIYESMFVNLDLAIRLNRPACQDTGIIEFFVRSGARFPYLGQLEQILRNAVLQATKEVPLRPNVVETFEEKNTGNNIGTNAPWINWEIVSDSDEVEIGIYMAGGGCSLPGSSKVFMPLDGYEGIVRYVFDTVTDRGINACPPLIIGIGIGSFANQAGILSKMALMRKVGSVNPNLKAAELEKRLYDGLNNVGIGPQGLTGRKSVIAVNIEYAAHHPATLAAGISVGCWSSRKGIIHIDKDLNYRILSHGDLNEKDN